MTAQRLDALAARATVRIGPAAEPDTLWGSGFFVAPGWVLTCAHVLLRGRGPEHVGDLWVHGHGVDAPARLAYCLGGGPDPEQDLALVRLRRTADDKGAGHVCVRLTDRYDPPLAVTAYGWRTPANGGPQRWQGHSECNGRDGAYGLTVAPATEIPHGASGGPLLDRERGVVAGIVKARRAHKDGGLAIAAGALRGLRDARPIGGERELGDDPYAALIRAHDRLHHGTTGPGSWVRAQDELPGPETGRAWRPTDAAAADALLAALPPPTSSAALQWLITKVLGDEPLWEDELAPRDWRDGQGWLQDQAEGPEILSLHYLRAVAHVCRRRAARAAEALDSWVEARAARLPAPIARLVMGVDLSAYPQDPPTGPPSPAANPSPGPAAAHAAPHAAPRAAACDQGPVVAVELEPDAYGPRDAFHWRIWSWYGDADTVRALDESPADGPTPLAGLPYVLDGPLRRAFGQFDAGERRARLELALPVEYFDLDVHLWRPPVASGLLPHPAERPFGVHRQVVLRCLKRRGEPADVWHERWRGVAEGGLKALPVSSPAYAGEVLDAGPPGAVPVLCRPPAESGATLTAAIRAGYGIALWSLRAEHTHGCGPHCDELHDGAARLLSRTGRAAALPEHLRVLRERVSQADTTAAWAEHLALLYDDPRRPIPQLDELPVESPS